MSFTLQTTLSENDNYQRALFVRIDFFHGWKCIILGAINFHTLEENRLSYFQKWLFLKKIEDAMSHIIR